MNHDGQHMRHVECIDDCDSSMLRALFLNNGIALALFDRDLRLIDANAEFENIVKYERGDYMFHAWKRMLDPSSMEKVQSFANMRFRDPRSAPSQYELTIVDGMDNKNTSSSMLASFPAGALRSFPLPTSQISNERRKTSKIEMSY